LESFISLTKQIGLYSDRFLAPITLTYILSLP